MKKHGFGLLMVSLATVGCQPGRGPSSSSPRGERQELGIAANVTYTVAGWNPGLKFRRAATHIPGSPLFFEACPDAPGGSCLSLGRGKGFFTLAHDQTPQNSTDGNNCKINSGAPYSPRSLINSGEASPNPNVACPYHFHWGVNGQPGPDAGKNFARIVVNTSGFTSPVTRNNYLGLQENFIGPRTDFLLGLDSQNPEHRIAASQVHSRKFKFRSRFCRSPATTDPHVTARFVHYFNLVKYGADGKVASNKTIALNFAHVRVAPPGTPSAGFHYVGDPRVLNEGVYSASLGSDRPDFNTWHIDTVEHIGMPKVAPFNDEATGCATPMENLGWTSVEFPVAQIINNMQQRGFLSANDVDGAFYTAGIVAGIESWGRALVEADIMDDQLVVKNVPTAAVPPVVNAPFYCDFNTEVIVESPATGPAVWKKIVDCQKPGLVPAGAPLEGSACKTRNRLGVYGGSTYLCVQDAAGAPAGMSGATGGKAAGYFQGPAGKYFSNGQDAFCWFNGPVPAGNTLQPGAEPNSLGYRNDGRCPFDQGAAPVPASLPAGYYQGPAGRFYTNGSDAFCWFAGAAPSGQFLQNTALEPNGLGLRNDGRCPFDK